MIWVFLNDRFVRSEDARISVFDHGFLYGDGVYETMRAYGGRIFLLHRHLERLERSAKLIGLDLPIPDQPWSLLLHDLLTRNTLDDAYIRVTVSRGPGRLGLDPHLCSKPTLVILALPLPSSPVDWFETGVRLTVATTRRTHPSTLSPKIKSLNFLNNILAKQEALERGAFDAVMLNLEGEITECTTSNIFFVTGGRVRTPAIECGLLDGITRETVLTLAREAGIEVEEGAYQPNAMADADECFLTNTTLEILPVKAIDRIPLALQAPGALTRRLQELFRANLSRFLE
ncbi:aminotransferase class IV [Candidatus Nitrospira bockiana]